MKDVKYKIHQVMTFFITTEDNGLDRNNENDLLDSEDDEFFWNIDSQNNDVVETADQPAVSDEEKNEAD